MPSRTKTMSASDPVGDESLRLALELNQQLNCVGLRRRAPATLAASSPAPPPTSPPAPRPVATPIAAAAPAPAAPRTKEERRLEKNRRCREVRQRQRAAGAGGRAATVKPDGPSFAPVRPRGVGAKTARARATPAPRAAAPALQAATCPDDDALRAIASEVVGRRFRDGEDYFKV